MKKIEAIIRHFKLQAVKEALVRAGIEGVTITEVYAVGSQKGRTGTFRGAAYVVDPCPMVKLEISIADALAPPAVEAIIEAARTGRSGDGRIAVLPLAEVVHIRTGQSETSARSRAA